MSHISKNILFLMILVVLSSCAAIQADDKAKSVKIVPSDYDLKDCEYITESFGLQGNIISYWFTQNSNLVTGALNNLKNKAVQVGGNVVSLEEGKDVEFGTSTVFVGYIYRCK